MFRAIPRKLLRVEVVETKVETDGPPDSTRIRSRIDRTIHSRISGIQTEFLLDRKTTYSRISGKCSNEQHRFQKFWNENNFLLVRKTAIPHLLERPQNLGLMRKLNDFENFWNVHTEYLFD
jgi:hypothetical protein